MYPRCITSMIQNAKFKNITVPETRACRRQSVTSIALQMGHMSRHQPKTRKTQNPTIRTVLREISAKISKPIQMVGFCKIRVKDFYFDQEQGDFELMLKKCLYGLRQVPLPWFEPLLDGLLV